MKTQGVNKLRSELLRGYCDCLLTASDGRLNKIGRGFRLQIERKIGSIAMI